MKDYSEHMHVYAICMATLLVLNIGAALMPTTETVTVPMVEAGVPTHHAGDLPQ